MLQAELRRRIDRHESRRRLWRLYPADGPLCRAAYPRHMEFFAAGATELERAIIAGNRTGKTTAAGYELTLHLTGRYPDWWRGRRFSAPIGAWAAGEDLKAMRESLQPKLFGLPKTSESMGVLGTGLIPGDDIVGTPTSMRGVPDAIDSASIRHVSGGLSRLSLKTYEQGRESFQGAKVDVGWCDEEPPQDVYGEFMMRLMSTVPGEPNGIMMATFTPLKGMSAVVMAYLGERWAPPARSTDFGADEVPA